MIHYKVGICYQKSPELSEQIKAILILNTRSNMLKVFPIHYTMILEQFT